ncbi:MAG: hypothetical protein AAF409_04025 [Pseudomonadota bacterium]
MNIKDLREPLSVSLRMLDKGDEPDQGPIAFVFQDRDGKELDRIVEKDGGEVRLDPEMINKAASVALVPAEAKLGADAMRAATKLSPEQLVGLVQDNGQLTLSPDLWRPLFPFTTCVSGKMRKCQWWPFFQRLQADRVVADHRLVASTATISEAARPQIDADLVAVPVLPRCKPVCNGTVEVYRRTCCRVFRIAPSQILELCERLKNIVERLPKIPRIPDLGPIPLPDPLPIEEVAFFRDGALDPLAQNAEADLAFLSKAAPPEAEAYILQRPWLTTFVWNCSPAVQVAEGSLGPGGAFNICWRNIPVILKPNCHVEYAFRVTQNIGGIETVIYNGLTTNTWFHPGDEIELTTYLPWARDCDELPPDHEHGVRHVFLSEIGLTPSWLMREHDQSGATPVVMTPDGKTGLVGGGPINDDRPGSLSDDSPWGGTLDMHVFFPDSLQDIGASHYRVAVQQISAGGTRFGPIRYMSNPITWKYDQGTEELPYTLNDPSDASFYKIPFESHDWITERLHIRLNTGAINGFPIHGSLVMTLELYTGPTSSDRIVPTGALDNSAGHTQADFRFVFRRPSGPRPVQPYTVLSHVVRYDNRPAVSDITAINPTDPMSELCQFVEMPGDTAFTANFRAYCQDEIAMRSWRLWYKRGLEPGTTTVQTGTTNHGSSVSAPASDPQTFAQMLGSHEKCAFALNVGTTVKTWSGYGRLSGLDRYDQIAFALINSTHGT